MQAVLATFGVFLVMLFLYATRIVKVTPRFVMVVIAATGGIFVMYLVGWVASLFGADIMFWNEPSPLGIGISVVIVIVAALNLALDFDFIEKAVKAAGPGLHGVDRRPRRHRHHRVDLPRDPPPAGPAAPAEPAGNTGWAPTRY